MDEHFGSRCPGPWERLGPWSPCLTLLAAFMAGLGGCEGHHPGGPPPDASPVACGNGRVDEGEACDGTDLGGATCASEGYLDGVLSCTEGCRLDSTGCAPLPVCGNGLLESGEGCDGTDLGGASCASLGFYNGTLGCTADCRQELTDCRAHGWCGDGIRDPGHGEECDGADLGGDSCGARGFDGGELACSAACLLDETPCSTCGDLLCELGEPTDCPSDCHGERFAIGQAHTCAIAADGSAWCWGGNENGKLGDGTQEMRTQPVRVLGPGGVGWLDGVEGLAGGPDHTCARRSDGSVWCWGGNAHGQLGNGEALPRLTPTRVLGPGGIGVLDDVVSVEAGGIDDWWEQTPGRTCAVRLDGALFCWGDNEVGALGDGTTDERRTPVQVVGVSGNGWLTDVVRVACGGSHTCAITSGGDLFCWGAGEWGQLGDGTWSDSAVPVPVATLSGIVDVDAGERHTCAVTLDGQVHCWGFGFAGRLGNDSHDDLATPSPVPNLGPATSIHLGDDHSCAMLADGTLWCWGEGWMGQHGNGIFERSMVPTQGATDLALVAAGYDHSCAISRTDGRPRCWGSNGSGEIGIGTTHFMPTPLEAAAGLQVLQVGIGLDSSCVLTSTGGTWCFGTDGYNKLGDNSDIWLSPTPVHVAGVGGVGLLNNAQMISTGHFGACALLSAGEVACWGQRMHGQLGYGSVFSHPAEPVLVAGPGGVGTLAGIRHISSGANHSCATRDDGSLWCWGLNDEGQMGKATYGSSQVPSQVVGPGGVGALDAIAASAAGGQHTCARRAVGTVFCWGLNSSGQLGDGTTTSSRFPVPVVGPTGVGVLHDVIELTAGREHTCALRSSGDAWCWGRGSSGQLGNGAHSPSSIPVHVELEPLSAITAGEWHTCAIVEDGSYAACWGTDEDGQLGMAQSGSSALPLAVPGLSDLTTIDAGFFGTCASTAAGVLFCWGTNWSGHLGRPDFFDQSLPVSPAGF